MVKNNKNTLFLHPKPLVKVIGLWGFISLDDFGIIVKWAAVIKEALTFPNWSIYLLDYC